jgi:hypothetical protein
MKLKFFALMSCLFFFTNISFSAQVDERKKLIKKLPREQRKIVQYLDKVTALPTISEIHLKKISKEKMNSVLRAYAKQKEREKVK